MVGEFLQVHHLQVGHGLFLGLFALDPSHLQGEHNVFTHRQPGEEGVLLEHDAAVGAGALHLFAVHVDVALGGGVQAADDVEEGGLAAAGGAHHADELVLMDIHIHAVEGDHLAVTAVELLYHMVDMYLYCCIVSCHPVNLLSRNFTIFSKQMPMTPSRMMPMSITSIW